MVVDADEVDDYSRLSESLNGLEEMDGDAKVRAYLMALQRYLGKRDDLPPAQTNVATEQPPKTRHRVANRRPPQGTPPHVTRRKTYKRKASGGGVPIRKTK